GLPYVSDAAITKHLAAFLKHQTKAGASSAPAAILFNGGVFQPVSLQKRLVEVMMDWFDKPSHLWTPLVLTTPSLDLAVAWGAAYYAWLRHSGGRRIGGGIARSYYVGVERRGDGQEAPDATLHAPDSALHVLCVVPRRLEENEEVVLP